MLLSISLPGAVGQTWLKTRLTIRKSLQLSIRGEVHPKEFNYRPPPSPLRGPSLGRGWILGFDSDAPERGLEVLLSKAEYEDGRDYPQTKLQWSRREEVLEHRDDVCRRFEEVKLSTSDEDQTHPDYVRGPNIDRKSFTRVYYISALQVPADESWDLAGELRKYLLNWPRVNNIGRVAGDDIDQDLASLYMSSSERKSVVSCAAVRSAVYDAEVKRKPRAKRQKVSNNRAPKFTTDNTADSSNRIPNSTTEKRAATTLELVEEVSESEPNDWDSAPGTLPGPEKWFGPTRLLLLNEKYAGMNASELPIDLQVVLCKCRHRRSRNSSGLVTCRLTLFYEYWSLDEMLQELLPAKVPKQVGFERTGHVVELKLSREQIPFRHLIGQIILDRYQPDVRSVVFKNHETHGDYVVQLELLAGSSSLVTTAWENGTSFRVDMRSVIWEPRLGPERLRLVQTFSKMDVVCDVQAGMGLVAIPAGKLVRRVYANDANRYAHYYLAKNVVDNDMTATVEVFNEDVKSFLYKVFYVERPLPITQLVMSHPSGVTDLLEFFRGAFDQRTWPRSSLPKFHVYGFSNSANPEQDFSQKITGVFQAPHTIKTNRVIEMAPGTWMIHASFVLPPYFGFQ